MKKIGIYFFTLLLLGTLFTTKSYAALNLTDQTSNGNNLTNSGLTSSSDLPFATNNVNAGNFAGSNYAYAANSASLSFTGSFTAQVWIKLTSLPANGAGVGLFNKLSSNPNWGWWFDLIRDDTREGGGAHYYVRMYISSNGSNLDDHYVEVFPLTNAWTNLSMVFTAANHKLEVWQDGISMGTDTSGTLTSINTNTADLKLGNDGTIIPGLADDFRLWNYALSGSTIASNYNQELYGNESGLVAYWPFETVPTVPTPTPTAGPTATPTPSSTASAQLNDFGFIMKDSVQGIVFALVWGLFLGFLIGTIRFIMLYFLEREKS